MNFLCQTHILPKLQSLPLIIVALDSAGSLPACYHDWRQKRNICVDSNGKYEFEDHDNEKHEPEWRQTRNICIYSNEDLTAANPETAELQGHSA